MIYLAEQNINVAQQDTLESVSSKIDILDTVADNIYSKVDTEIGATGDTGGSATAGSIMGKLNKVISDLTTHMGRWTATRAGYIDTINTNAARLTSARATIIDNIGATGNTGGTTSAGTVMAKLNAILSKVNSSSYQYYTPSSTQIANLGCYTTTISTTGATELKVLYKMTDNWIPSADGIVKIVIKGTATANVTSVSKYSAFTGVSVNLYSIATGGEHVGGSSVYVNITGSNAYLLSTKAKGATISSSSDTLTPSHNYASYNKNVTLNASNNDTSLIGNSTSETITATMYLPVRKGWPVFGLFGVSDFNGTYGGGTFTVTSCIIYGTKNTLS